MVSLLSGKALTWAKKRLVLRTLAANYCWNETALITVFRQELEPTLHTDLAIHDDSVGLENLIQYTVRMSQCLAIIPSSKPTAYPSRAPILKPQNPPDSEPMQIDQNRLSREERARRFSQCLCLY